MIEVEHDPAHAIARHSRRAIEACALLAGLGRDELATRLYHANTMPRTAFWEARFADRAAVAAWLGLAPGKRRVAELTRVYRPYRQEPARADPWMRWRHRGQSSLRHLRHKLYVSPHPDDLPATFRRVVDLCIAMHVPAFKVGGDVSGVLRPDKLILYFGNTETSAAVARELAPLLEGVRPHGVPFTTPADPGGGLSSGQDCDDAVPAGWRGGRSWRAVVADRIAAALLETARHAGPDRLRLTLDRVMRYGIDPVAWRAEAAR